MSESGKYLIFNQPFIHWLIYFLHSQFSIFCIRFFFKFCFESVSTCSQFFKNLRNIFWHIHPVPVRWLCALKLSFTEIFMSSLQEADNEVFFLPSPKICDTRFHEATPGGKGYNGLHIKSQSITEKNQDRNSRQDWNRNWSRDHRRLLLTSLLSLVFAQLAFLYSPELPV